MEILKARGFASLYTHQALAFTLAREGKNLVVVTPTASGKTLCYNLPILSELMENPEARALYLFPTKALSQDQLVELNRWTEQLGDEVRTFTYDGDTPQDARKAIRARGNLVITNPDMLHAGILPHHTKWQRLFENLRYVVIDELHYYRGVLGSHLANVLRRLKRVARFYGSSPQFICTSATIANPQELATRILEEDVTLIDDNGAPAAEKYFVCYNPPVVNPQLGIRRSYLNETRRLAKTFLSRGLQTIIFANSRLATEILVTYLQEDFSQGPRDAASGARLPRRLPAAGAPGNRARPAQRPLAWSGGNQRPRTGHRCGQPGCGAARRLPRDDRLHLAASGPRRADVGAGGSARRSISSWCRTAAYVELWPPTPSNSESMWAAWMWRCSPPTLGRSPPHGSAQAAPGGARGHPPPCSSPPARLSISSWCRTRNISSAARPSTAT